MPSRFSARRAVPDEPVNPSGNHPGMDGGALLDVHAVAKLLGCSARTVRRWDAAELIPGRLKIQGHTVRWRRADVVHWIQQGMPGLGE